MTDEAGPRTERIALAVIGQNVVIDFGSHEAAMEGIDRVRIEAEAALPDSRLRAALNLPGHKCRMVARATPLMEGRDIWLGELTGPYPGFEHETHCLHVTTPQKSVVFGVYRGDFDILAVLGSFTGSRVVNERWLASRVEAYRRAALSLEGRQELVTPWPTRDEFAAMTPAELNAYLESVGADVRVASPEGRQEPER